MPGAEHSVFYHFGTTIFALILAFSLIPSRLIFANSDNAAAPETAAATAVSGTDTSTPGSADSATASTADSTTASATSDAAANAAPGVAASSPAASSPTGPDGLSATSDDSTGTASAAQPDASAATSAASDSLAPAGTAASAGNSAATDASTAANADTSANANADANSTNADTSASTNADTNNAAANSNSAGAPTAATSALDQASLALDPGAAALPDVANGPTGGIQTESADQYSVTFDPNGGFSAAATSTQTYYSGDEVTVSFAADQIPHKADMSGSYDFLGWAFAQDASQPDLQANGTTTFTITQDTTLYAVWGGLTPYAGISPASAEVDIHMHDAIGYTIYFYILLPDYSGIDPADLKVVDSVTYYVQVLTCTSNLTTDTTILSGTGELAFAEVYRTSDGNLVERIGPDLIGHVSSSTAHLTSDGTMGASGRILLNTGDINFWYMHPLSGSTTLALQAKKSTIGTNLQAAAGLFEFALCDEHGNPVKDSQGNPIVATNNPDGSIVFPNINYTQADMGNIYTYTVKETGFSPNISSADQNGWTLDNQVYTVQVQVISDNGLVAQVISVNNSPVQPDNYSASIVFTNTYAASTSVVWAAKKVAVGHSLADGQFTFGLYAEGSSTPLSTATNQGGDITFRPISYQTDGTYNYTIKEIDTGTYPAGWTIDTNTYQVRVIVSGHGATATTQYYQADMGRWVAYDPADIVFTNTYRAAPATLIVSAIKDINTGTLRSGMFYFELLDSNGTVLQTRSNNGTHVTFDAITFTAPGTYTYTVREVPSTLPGWTSDSKVYTVTVVVEDIDGQLTITGPDPGTGSNPTPGPSYYYTDENGDQAATCECVGIVFDNTYAAAGTWSPAATKAVVGTTLAATAGLFDFAVLDNSGNVVSTGTNAADGSVSFTPIAYSQDDIGQTFNYTIKETTSGLAGWTLDTATYAARVTVLDNGNGTLSARAEYQTGTSWAAYDPSQVVFTNSYTAPSTDFTPQATKVAMGKDMAAGQFDFALYSSDANGNYNATSGLLGTATNSTGGASSPVNFSKITYTSAGTRYYVMAETSASGHGWAADASKYLIKVDVTDDGFSSLHTTVTYSVWDATSGASGAWVAYSNYLPVFTNTYQPAPAQLILSATKTINSGTLRSGMFTFQLLDSSGAVLQTKSNNGTHVTFDAISFTAPGTYTYTVREVATALPGWTSSSKVYTVTVVVEDIDGQLTITGPDPGTGANPTPGPSYYYIDENGQQTAACECLGIVFDNTYAAAGAWTPAATKAVEGTTLSAAAGMFSFAVLDAEGNVVSSGTNAADGSIAMTPIPYTQADIGQTFNYTIKETTTGLSGWTLDTAVYNVRVTVLDNEDGTLSARAEYQTGTSWAAYDPSQVVFTNSYMAPSTDFTPQATKVADGKDMAAGQFAFALYNADAAGDYDAASGLVGTATNSTGGASSPVNFSKITYTTAGTRYYVMAETSTDGQGWTVDTAKYLVKVDVTDDGFSSLHTTVTYSVWDAATGTWAAYSGFLPAFTNTYQPAPVQLVLTATKGISAGTLNNGMFFFELLDSNGVVLQTRSNTGTSVTFVAIAFTAPGTYTVTVHEAATTLPGWTIDPRSYTVTVTVEDVDGQLAITGPGPNFGPSY
ncbi:MAG: hypothetical protein FWF30_01895, partial [Coriobacteriia bacterium]|nr:hypothetical protein [Coriobacteriia bacterium]